MRNVDWIVIAPTVTRRSPRLTLHAWRSVLSLVRFWHHLHMHHLLSPTTRYRFQAYQSFEFCDHGTVTMCR
jgi:hypothetical protein